MRWTGKVHAPLTDTYTFHTDTDDGVRLWIDNKLIIDKWEFQPQTEWTAKVDLVAGKRYTIRMDYLENNGIALARLFWSSPQFDKAIISKPYLFGEPVVTATEPDASGSLTMFPSPAREQVTVRYEALTSGAARLEIYDLLGRRIHEQPIRFIRGRNDYLIPTTNWPAGLYQVAIRPANQPAVYRRLLVR